MIIKKDKLPNGWQWLKLEDVCKIETGTTPSRAKPAFFGEGLPWVTPGDFDGSMYISKSREALTEAGIQEGKGKVFAAKTVLLVCIGTIGKIAVAAKKISANQQINALICGSKVYPEFLYFYLVYNKANLVSVASSSTVPIINQERLGTIEISLPPLAEQKRIIAIAQKADRLRCTRRYALQLSDTYLQSVFLEMFGDPVTNSMGWKTECLGELGNGENAIVDGPFGSSVDTKIDYIPNGEIPVIRSKNIRPFEFITDDLKFISREKFNLLIRSRVVPGDILLVKVGVNLGDVCIFTDVFKEAVLSTTGSCKITPNNNIVATNYLASYLYFLKGQMRKISSESAQPFLNMTTIKEFQIALPPLPLQEKFAQIVQKFERLRTQQREAERQAEHLFQTILHRAFGGELTSSDINQEPASDILDPNPPKPTKPETSAKTGNSSTRDAAKNRDSNANQLYTEAIQLNLPGFE